MQLLLLTVLIFKDYLINIFILEYKNRPNFDNFLNICNECDWYIGCGSGSTEFISTHSNTYIKYINLVSSFILNHRNSNTISMLRNVNALY